jgi:hypothetical protein
MGLSDNRQLHIQSPEQNRRDALPKFCCALENPDLQLRQVILVDFCWIAKIVVASVNAIF